MLKRLFCTMLALAMVIPGGAALSAESGEQTAENEQAQTEEFKGFDLTFDDDAENYGFDIITVQSAAKEEEGKQGKGLKMATGHFAKMFDAPIDKGLYRYSFDFCDSKNEPVQALTRVFGYAQDKESPSFDTDKMYEGLLISGSSAKSYNNHNALKTNGWKRWTLSNNAGKYTAGEWSHIDVYYDLDNGFTYLYVNNEFVTKEKIGYEIKEIYGIDISVEKGSWVVDNYKFEKLDYSLEKEIAQNGGIPREFVDPLDITFESTSFAYNYFGDTAEIILNMQNQTGSAKEFELTYKAVDDKGFCIWEKSEKLSFDKDESKRHSVKVSPGRYGLYTLQVSAAADGVEFSSDKRHKFTLIKAPEDGVVNQETAIHELFPNERQQQLDYVEPVLDMYEKAGFWGTRSSVVRNGIKNWQGWQPGIPIDYDYYTPLLNYIKNNRMETMLTLSGSKVSYNHVPVTEDELNDWSAFCYRVASDTKDYVNVYEIWNEPNASAFNVNATAEQYAKAVQVASEAVKKANPDAKIAAIALSGTGKRFVEDVLKVAADSIDYVTIHPYMWMQSPENGGLVPSTEEVIKVMEKYGLSRDKLWYGEVGFYSHVGYENMTAYTTQMFLLKDAYDLASKIFIFRYTDGTTLPREGFGIINSIIDNEPFMARKAFLAMSAYNALMTDNTPNGIIDYDESQKLYKFKLRDGRDCIVMWNNNENREVSLDLGCDSVEVYDVCGNADTIYGINQKYQFSFGEMPIYVVGQFGKSEKCDNIFETDKDDLKIVNGDSSELNITNMSGRKLKAVIETTKEISAEKEVDIADESKKIPLKAGDISKNTAFTIKQSGYILHTADIEDIYNDYGNGVRLHLYDGDKQVYSKQLEVECINPIDVTHFSEHFAGERWQYVVEVTNNTYDTPLDGTIKINASKSFSSLIPEWRLGTVKPGETKRTTFPIPDLLDYNDLTFNAELTMSNGYSVNLSRELSFRAIPKNRNKPKIDGVLGPGEWNESYAIDITEKTGKYLPLIDKNFGGDSDLSGKTYVEFDDENLYFAAKVTDDIQKEDADRGIWAGDSIQLGFSLERSATAPYTELNIGFKNGEPAISRSSTLVGQLVAVDIPHELAIKRDESKKETTYELIMPLNEIFPANFKIKNTSGIAFSILINDRDTDEHTLSGEGRDGMLEYGSGIGSGKNPELFLDFNLVR